MSDKISAKEYSLSKIFSADFEYHIPKYQRPYSWTEDEAAILFDDLYDFYEFLNCNMKLNSIQIYNLINFFKKDLQGSSII